MTKLDDLIQQNRSIQIYLHLNYSTISDLERENAIAKLSAIGQEIQALQLLR